MQLKYILFLILLSACTKEPDLLNYSIRIANISGEQVDISTYSEGILQEEIKIENNNNGLYCSYSDERFKGYSNINCDFDSLKVLFDNSEGYLFSLNFVTNFEFSDFDNHPFGGKNDKTIETTTNNFEFTISETDFVNAHELPK